MFDGPPVRREGPPQVAAHRRGADPGAGARRGLRRGDGQLHQLQHGVDLDLRAHPDVRVPGAAGQGERLGRPPRPDLPRRRQRRRRCGAAGRLRRPQLEARRQGHGALQLRRRPGPVGPRRLHARRQPAHLGVRVQLRRPRRAVGRQGQPAHAQAGAPQLGGVGGQRAVRLDLVPHAGQRERDQDEAGRLGARVGRDRRPRRLRLPARAERRWRSGGRSSARRTRSTCCTSSAWST